MSRYLAEEPIDSIDDGLVSDLLRFFENPPSTGLNVVGLFGARGLGKTSYLRTLAKKAREKGFPLPTPSEKEPHIDPLFQPSRLDRVDDLFSDLLEHLKLYGGPHVDGHIQKIHGLQARRNRPDDFRKAANEEAGSRERLAAKLGEEAREAGQITQRIREAVGGLCEAIRQGRQGLLLLLIDDLDLQPERALRLLDILQTYFHQPKIQVVVVLAADGDLLADSVAEGLKHYKGPPGLAWWNLQKLIPVRFHLPTWTAARGFADHLWPDPQPEGSDSPLPHLWPDLRPAQMAQGRQRQWSSENRQQALQALGEVAPRTPRGFKRLHNELLRLREQAFPSGRADMTPQFASDLQVLGVLPGAGLALRVMLLSAEERAPFLGLNALFEQTPEHLVDTFRRLADQAPEDKKPPEEHEGVYDQRDYAKSANQNRSAESISLEAWLLSGSNAHIPLADRLREPYPGGRQRLDALNVVLALVRFWRDYRADGDKVRIAQRLLALSFNADALESGRSLLQGPYKAAELTHLDLRSLAPSLRLTPDAVITAWRDLARQVDLSGIADYQGPLGLISRAIYSLILWLGWRLHRLRAVTAYNFFRGELLPFQGPTEVMRYEQSTLYFFLKPQDRSHTDVPLDAHEAVIIIDLIGRVAPTDLDTFLPEVPHRWIIGRPIGSRPLEPTELEPALRDIIELLGELRYLRQVDTFHLGLSMPDVAAFFLGQQLHEWGTIKLYEHSERGYEHTIDLVDPRDARP